MGTCFPGLTREAALLVQCQRGDAFNDHKPHGLGDIWPTAIMFSSLRLIPVQGFQGAVEKPAVAEQSGLEARMAPIQPGNMPRHSPFRYFKTSPEIIRLAVMMYGRLPLSLQKVADVLHERGIDICRETARF